MDFDRYQITMEPPRKLKRVCGGCGTLYKDSYSYCRICGRNLVYQRWSEKAEYKRELKAYHKEKNRFNEQFKHDALDDVGLLNHPKADEIFEYAWEHGHSEGLYMVHIILCNICHLFD